MLPATVELGSFLAAAYLLGTFLFWRAGRAEGFASDDLFDYLLVSSFAALAGGRILFLLSAGKIIDPMALIRVGEGINWVGAVGIGIAAAYFFARAKGWSFLKIADLTVFPLAASFAVGLGGAAALSLTPQAIYLFVGYLFLAALTKFWPKRFPLGTSFFVYLLVFGLLVFLSEWNMALNLNLVFGFLFVIAGFVGLVAMRLPFWLKRSNEKIS